MDTHYDFVTVGGGLSGLVVAARLTEDPKISVLVVEAGQDHSANLEFVLRRRGSRHSKAAIDAWASFGSPGWDWKTLGPYFRKFHSLSRPSPETCKRLRLDYIDDDVRGTDGPVQASFPETDDPVPAAWSFFGGYINAVIIDPKDCTRSGSTTAYFEPAKGRPNLHVSTGALAEKIIFDTSGKIPKATGIQISKDATTSVLTARREVILAAGVFGTPKLLELSGVGGKPLLEKLGIPLVVENPNVGENLQDHPNTGVSFEVADGVKTKVGLSRQEPEAIKEAMQDYINRKRGPLAVGGNFAGALIPVPDFVKGTGAEALLKQILDDTATEHIPGDFTPYHEGFVRSLLSKPNEGVANIFTYAVCGNLVPKGAGSAIITQAAESGNFITVSTAPLFPLSRGYSHINSTDVSAKPTIDPRYMMHPLDVEVLARLVGYIDTITKTEPFSKLLKPGGRRSYGAPDDLTDLEQVKAYIKTSTLSCWHPTSACALLPRERGGVVDPQLQVYGVDGLRIVDSSVIPVQTRGNTQTTVYAVAERAADLIKDSL